MTKITIEVPDELSDKIAQLGDRFPEILALSLQQPAIPAHIYRYIINFIARQDSRVPLRLSSARGRSSTNTRRNN